MQVFLLVIFAAHSLEEVIKSEDELNLLRYVNKVSKRAQMEVMRKE